MKRRRMQFVAGMAVLGLVMFGLVTENQAQPRAVNVSPGFGTLNQAIDGDTTSTGARVDSSTVYMLQRGGVYILDGSIENRFPLTIMAEDGSGDRPQLIPGVGSGGESARPFRPRADLTIRGLYVTNEDELGGLNTRIIRISADNARIVVDDCHLDKDGQSAFRFDNENNKVFVTNSIISNIGQTSSPNNGRGFDDRGNMIDTLVVENSTFYNLTSRVLRDDGGVINYAKFNHNTMVNIGQRVVTFGPVVEASFTNNLVINPSFYGSGALETEEKAHVDVDSVFGVTQKVNIRNNNFYLDPAVVAVYPDTVSTLANFDPLAESFLTAGTTIEEAITFTDGPASPVDVVNTFYTDPGGTQPPLDTSGEPFDFSYPMTTTSYAFSTASQPLGALTWFGLAIEPPTARIVQVAPGFGTLNQAIDGDTTASGNRVNPNTTYMLQRGGVYILDGSIENRFPLTIMAEDGSGDRPQLIPGVGSGGESSRPFRPRADLTIRGLYVTNEDELGGLNTRIIRISADNARIVVDDCHLDKDGQSAFRFDNENNKVFVTNSIISNIGQTSSPNNGRGFDDRGNMIDTLVVENSTFYNLTSRVLRDDGGVINYAKFNHNTMVNIGQRVVTFGPVVEASFTNNLVINPSFYGSGALETEEKAHVDVDSVFGVIQVVNIRNNNFYLDPAVVAVYPDTVSTLANFDPLAQAYINAAGTGSTIIEEAITFENGPAAPVDVVNTFYTDPGGTQPPLDTSGEPFDFIYPESTVSFTGATANQPLGALTWFGLDIITGVQNPLADNGGVPEAYQLLSNYPNPFNPSTKIRYALPRSSVVTLTIYNMIGQRIRTLVNEKKQASGAYEVQWDGMDDLGRPVASGVYIYHIEAGQFRQSSKMLLLK